MSIEEIFMYYDYGIEHEKNSSNILVNRIAVGLFGAKEKPKPIDGDQPDRKGFYKRHGSKIKRPRGGRV